MSSPPVPVVDPPEPPQPLTLVCANCGSALDGEYCSACGQRHEPRLHTVAHFAAEAFESISHADSRLWKTLWYLLSRPGFLTREFFEGRRVRYLPPFRLYLVISVVFFLVVGMPEGDMYKFDGKPTTARVQAMNDAAGELEKASGPGSEVMKQASAAIKQKAREESAALTAGETSTEKKEGLQDENAMTEFCDEFKKPDPTAGRNYGALHKACSNIAEDKGAALVKTIVHNIPRAMFVFLPLLALVMKPLYWKPKRYYVEHLLFLVHNHAFVFLVLSVLALLGMIRGVGQHLGLVSFASWVYMIWYMYRGMRNVYGQGRALTLVKYFTLGFAYICAAFTVLLLTALYSAMTFS